VDAVIVLSQDLQRHEAPFFDRLQPAESVGLNHIEKTQEEMAKHKGRFLVAVSDNKVVGYATVYLEVQSPEDPTAQPYVFAGIGDLMVAEKSRGQGIGKLLMRECEGLARRAGRQYLQLSVLGGNASARKFYAEDGLRELYVRLEKKL
jgi:GNAT superfamily N-acetyltransferase